MTRRSFYILWVLFAATSANAGNVPINYGLISRWVKAGEYARISDGASVVAEDVGTHRNPATGTHTQPGVLSAIANRNASMEDLQGSHYAQLSAETTNTLTGGGASLGMSSGFEWSTAVEAQGTGNVQCVTRATADDANNAIFVLPGSGLMQVSGSVRFKANAVATVGPAAKPNTTLDFILHNRMRITFVFNPATNLWTESFYIWDPITSTWQLFGTLTDTGYTIDKSFPLDSITLAGGTAYLISTHVQGDLMTIASNTGVTGGNKKVVRDVDAKVEVVNMEINQ